MTLPVGGIDPHQDTFTVGIVDYHGVKTCHETFDNTAAGYVAAIDLLDAHAVGRVGVEGSAKWGAHIAIAFTAPGFDTREVPASRSAAQRRSRRSMRSWRTLKWVVLLVWPGSALGSRL